MRAYIIFTFFTGIFHPLVNGTQGCCPCCPHQKGIQPNRNYTSYFQSAIMRTSVSHYLLTCSKCTKTLFCTFGRVLWWNPTQEEIIQNPVFANQNKWCNQKSCIHIRYLFLYWTLLF